jgi:CRP/FNR family transcriptional regulator
VPREFPSGSPIFSRGDPARSVFLVCRGRARVYVSDPGGKERTLRIAGPGELFAEAAVFQDGGYPASSAALTGCVLLEFPKESLLGLIHEHPGLALATIAILASRLRELTDLIEASLKEVLPRLASYLLKIPSERGSFRLPLRKVELARHLGTTPESLSRALGQLKDLGLVKEEKSQVVIMDKAGLEELSLG